MVTLKEAKQLVSHLEGLREKRLAQQMVLGRLMLPSRGLFKGEDPESLRNGKLFNNAAQRALRKAAAGMTQAITPASNPWFRHAFMRREDREATGANEYVDTVDNTLRAILSAGGFYRAIHVFNKELLAFGCALLCAEEAPQTVARFDCQTCGTYCVALDADKRVDCVCRRLTMTPRQLADRFGEARLCSATKAKLKTSPYEPVCVCHLCQRRAERQHGKEDARNKPVASLWWEDSGADDFLAESGFDEMPYFFATWEEGRGVYGTGPGDEALPDQKGVESWERRKAVGLEKMISPPLVSSGPGKAHIDQSPGVVIPSPAGGYGQSDSLKPLYNLNFGQALQYVQEEINQLQMRLEDIMHATIFANMSLETRPAGMTMTEYMDRRRRSAELMGPVVSSYEPRILTPLLERVYNMAERWGLLPPPPQGLSPWASINVSYQSPMAQMLEQSGAVAIQSLMDLLPPIVQVSPEVADKLDLDQAVDELAQRLGVPASVVRSDATVAALRQQRAEAQAQQQQAQQLAQAAQLAAQLGNVRTQGTVAGQVVGAPQEDLPQ